MKKQITLSLEQAERINAILREFKLTEMSIKSYSLWFSKPIYRDVTTLSKEEIFKLFYILKYDELLTHTCVSLLDNSMIVEPVAKKFQVCIQPNQNINIFNWCKITNKKEEYWTLFFLRLIYN